MMRSRFLAMLVCVVLLPILAPPPPAYGADDLGWLQGRKISRQAKKALEAGQLEEAVKLYEQVLAGTEKGDALRARALYVVAFMCLSPEKAHRDLKRAGQLLEELKSSYPDYEGQLEVTIASSWTKSLSTAQSSAGRLRRQTKDQDAKVGSLETEIEKLKGELAATRQELAATREELKKKEEALQKVREELVGGGG
ncbi:MAG: hypothetical protein GY856_22190 [bacterium]|nr:hypothetical protein [bacterium]